MRMGVAVWLAGLFLTINLSAAEAGFPLPIRKVVLYKSGVGYFVHEGAVTGSQTIEIPLSSSQLDDVLKSLTALDLNGGRIGVVTYESSAPIARQLGDLPIDLGSDATIVETLNRLRGAELVLQLPGEKLEGRLVSVELRSAVDPRGGEAVVLALFVPPADMRTISLDRVSSLTFADSGLANDIGRYLELEGSRNERSLRRLRFRAEGSGERNLLVSYTAEAPIWKATYRVVVRTKEPAILQGWAIVDNTTPLDWTDVQLSLVSGAPVSFVQRLSEPVYADRPVVALPQGIRVAPATHEGTMEETAPKEAPAYVGDRAAGIARSRMAPEMAMAAPPPSPMAAFDQAFENSVRPAAEAGALAEQFEYRLEEPLTINRNQSALLPIVQSPVSAEKVSVFNESRDATRPRLALWLENSSGATLDGGSFSVIDAGAFAGEGIFETIQPGERRLLSYALDLAVEVSTRSGTEAARVERAAIQNGILTIQSKLTEKRTYLIRNNAGENRSVMIEHPVRPNWALAGSLRPVESSNSYYRFRVAVGPSQTATLEVLEERPERTVFQLTDLSPEQIGLWIRDRKLSSGVESALRRVSEKKVQVSQLERQLASLSEDEAQIFNDQQRIRENLGRLSRTAEEAALRQRYLDQLSAQEDRLAEIRQRKNQLEEELQQARKELADLIRNLNVSESGN